MSVDSADTPTTVNSVARSFSGCGGSAAASASAAEAPQIAVAPPLSRPNSTLKPISRATTIDTPMVSASDTATSSTGRQPSATTCAAVMRNPSSATPQRSTWRAVNSMPGLHGPSAERKFIAMPRMSANSITGAP
ncbi:hypothetical protein D9M69_511810 [compost metagenome]